MKIKETLMAIVTMRGRWIYLYGAGIAVILGLSFWQSQSMNQVVNDLEALNTPYSVYVATQLKKCIDDNKIFVFTKSKSYCRMQIIKTARSDKPKEFADKISELVLQKLE